MVAVTVELSDRDAQLLRTWASVGRLLDATLRVMEDSSSSEKDSVIEDMMEMQGALNNLCFELRRKLVEMNIKPLWNPLG